MRVLAFAIFLAASSLAAGQSVNKAAPAVYAPATIATGGTLFLQHCAFCHGRDAGGGEDGPDLTRSKLVGEDSKGNKIAPVIRDGRPQNGMPSFALSDPDVAALVAFIHDRKIKAESQKGGRRGVDVADLQTGNVEAGRQYFNGAGNCVSCHSPTGDLAGVAKRYATVPSAIGPGPLNASLIRWMNPPKPMSICSQNTPTRISTI